MVMTVLEAKVDKDSWEMLKTTFQKLATNLPAEIVSTYLIQDTNAQDIWKIVTIWESEEALNKMRQSGVTPTGVLIFNEAGAEPQLSIFDISESASH